jgi:4a-hydroxytetrahydrobiopterin dehydratase
LKGQAIVDYLNKLNQGWNVVDDKLISKEFPFKNFNLGMAFLNKIAALADQEGHHPDVYISFSKVQVELFTHAINGLSENDFMCIKTGLRVAPHFKYQNEVVVKLHPKILRAANDLFNDDGVHDLTFMLVPISAKASKLVAHIKDKP